MTDILELVADFAPTSAMSEWTVADQDTVLAAIIDDAEPVSPSIRIPLAITTPRRRRHRVGIAASVVALTAVAAAVVAIVAGGGGSGGGNAPTHQPTGRNRFWNPPPGLSDQALPNGKYSYRVIDMLARFPGRTLITGVDRSYVATNGVVVSFRSGNDTGCYRFPVVYRGLSEPTKAFFATLPTDPDKLNEYLRSHVSGSTSRDEAVFVAVGEALRTADALASPKLRAAFLAVLSRTPGVTVFEGQRDDLNHPAIRADFVDQANRPGEVQSLYFDPTTFQLTEEGGGTNGQPTTGKEQFPPYTSHPKPGVDPVRLRHRGGQVMRTEQVVGSIPECRHPKP